MINLYVKKYCHECPDFESKIEKEQIFISKNAYHNMTNITCVNAERCESIKKYLEDQQKYDALKKGYEND